MSGHAAPAEVWCAMADPVQLTLRANALRRLATKLADCPVGGLASRADHETWLGPTADSCRADLAAHVTSINAAVEDLLRRAQRLDHLAASISPVAGVQ